MIPTSSKFISVLSDQMTLEIKKVDILLLTFMPIIIFLIKYIITLNAQSNIDISDFKIFSSGITKTISKYNPKI